MGRVKVGGKEVEKKNVKEGDIGHEVREWNGKEKGNEREWRRREWHHEKNYPSYLTLPFLDYENLIFTFYHHQENNHVHHH